MSSVILGTDVETGYAVRIGDIERRSGLYLLGRPGMGKSAAAVNIAIQDIDNGHGLFFLDPHGDAVYDLLRRGDADKLNKLAYLFDPQDEGYSFGINLLQCHNVASLTARMDTYTRAYNVFQKIWEEEWGVWLQLILQNVLHAFIENQGYTLADVPMFLNPRNVEFRNHIIDNIIHEPQVADFWRYEFFERREQSQQERVDAALTRINTLLTHRYVRDIVGQAKTTIDFTHVLASKQIILLKLSANLPEDVKKFIGTILLSEFVFALRDRPEDKRTQFCIFVDEFHNFASTDHMAIMTTEGRKFGAAATYLHVERFGQLAHNQKLLGATQAIVNKGMFQSTVNDADEFAPEFAQKVEPTEIRQEEELVFSPRIIGDIWDNGHPSEELMYVRNRYFWIIEALRNRPRDQEYLLFDSSRILPEYMVSNPVNFKFSNFNDWEWYRSREDHLRWGLSLLSNYYMSCLIGNYDLSKPVNEEQLERMCKIIKTVGGVFGFLPYFRPHIPPEKYERLVYLMNEKLKQEYEQNRWDKIQAIKNEIQYLKDHGVKEEHFGSITSGGSSRDYSQITPVNISNSRSYPIINYKGGTKEDFEKQEVYLQSLWMQVRTLEQSQPPQFTGMPSSLNSSKDIEKIKFTAIQAGMPTHEIENLIEWEPNPLTPEEDKALSELVRLIANMNVTPVYHEQNRTRIRKQYAIVMGDRYYKKWYDSDEAFERSVWQIGEMIFFISFVLESTPIWIKRWPVKARSGIYKESLRVERTQQDLNNEVANELVNLPRFQLYTKLIDESQGRQIVRTYRMKTHPLPAIQSMETELQAIVNGYTLGKKRDEIEAEIRERQSRWARGGSPPGTRGR